MPEHRTFVPAEIDLSDKEIKTRVQDELKNLLEAIRASVDVYPEDSPQHMQEEGIFIADKPQEVNLEDYPNIQKLYKSFIADDILQGGGQQLYEPKQIEQFLEGTKQFYRESTGLTTEGYFDVNIISELGFSSSPDKLKNFLKDVGVVGQTGLSRGLREVFRYFTGTFQDTGLTPISAAYKGRNPELYNTLESLPFLESVGEGRFIVKLLTRPEDTKTIFADATDLVPVYEKFRSLKPAGDRTLPEQMQHLKAMKDEIKLPSQQGQDLLRYLVYEYSAEQDKDRQKRLDENPELTKRIEEKRRQRKTVTFQPDPQPEQVKEEIPEEKEELKKIPVPIKPKKAVKPSGTSPLAEKLRQRAEARLKAANQKAAKRLGIQPDDTKNPETVPAKKAKKKPDPKGGPKIPGFGPLFILDQLYQLVPGMGPVDAEGRPVAKLEDQMNKLTG